MSAPVFVLAYCFVCEQNVKAVFDGDAETARPVRHDNGRGSSCDGRFFSSDEFEPMPAEATS